MKKQLKWKNVAYYLLVLINVQVVLVGDHCVGKTTIIKRFCEGKVINYISIESHTATKCLNCIYHCVSLLRSINQQLELTMV